ncbi:MAG: hypothetical protein ISS71_07440 [Phycisphaerae bacterium]|nr:hypothetical protein [Phycisphaerae bacterium]
MNKHNNKFEAVVKAFTQGTVPQGPSDDLVRQTLERIEQTKTNPLLERILKMKPITKIAAAAIIIVGISAIFLFPTGGQSIALAAVYDKVLQSQAFMYKVSMTMNGTMVEGAPSQNMESEGIVTISTKYGMKMKSTIHMLNKNKTMTQEMYFLPCEKKVIQIIPSEKAYVTMAFSEDLLQKTKEQNNDPREMIKKIMKTEYTDLGFSEIDGIKVQGFQTTDPAYAGNMCDEVNAAIWVDVETWLPVRSEFTMRVADTLNMKGEMYDYVWNAMVQADDFVPVIPEDYKSMGNIELPKMDENAAIEGLRLFADLTGTYPEKIDMMSIMKSIGKIKNSETEAAIEFKKQMNATKTEEEKAQVMMEKMVPLQSLGMFYATLMQGKKDPAYYGDVVTPDDTDAVLMRWKNDDGTYTVIFGDLTSVEMEYEDLIVIEPEPLPESVEPMP